jgi:hypothetical protein
VSDYYRPQDFEKMYNIASNTILSWCVAGVIQPVKLIYNGKQRLFEIDKNFIVNVSMMKHKCPKRRACLTRIEPHRIIGKIW